MVGKDWITWEEAQATRLACLEATKGKLSHAKRLQFGEDLLIICFHTVAPPDRVGVIRRLALGATLIRKGSTGWTIDLTSFKHKDTPSHTTLTI